MILSLSKNTYKGMGLLSLLLSLTIFSGILLAFNQWASQQRKSAVAIYQGFQAVQIAQNQKQREFLGLPCENSVRLNQLYFEVKCQNSVVIVKYPSGEFSL